MRMRPRATPCQCVRAMRMRVGHVEQVSEISSSSRRTAVKSEVDRKRERDEDEEMDVSSVKCVSPVKKVRGVVLEVSPMKKGKTGTSFFDGRISDGVSSMRFVGFDSKVRRRIVEYEGKDTAVTLSSKCEIKRGRHDGDGLEVHVKNATEVVKSEKKFDVSKGEEAKG